MAVLCAFVGLTALARADDVTSLQNGHAHNDYRHERPLFDALAQGFCSFEADIHLVDGLLLVAHDLDETRVDQTLEKLYLDPLQERVRANGGHLFPQGANGLLLIDIKSDGEATYAVLRDTLARYADMLTIFEAGQVRPGAVTVVISGNRPRATMAAERLRYCGYDGRIGDLEGGVDPAFMPLVSEHWGTHFRYRGGGTLSAVEREKLRALVQAVHDRGAKIRFWATPERPAMWRELADAGVDLINTDRLTDLRTFLLEDWSSQRESDARASSNRSRNTSQTD